MTNAPHTDGRAAAATAFGPDEFAAWGLNEIAYVEPILAGGETVYGLFAANGRRLGVAPDAASAAAAALQKDLFPLPVH